MTDKQRAALVIDGIGLDGWDVVFGLKSEGGGYKIVKNDQNQSFKLNPLSGITKKNVQNFVLSLSVRDERLSLIHI